MKRKILASLAKENLKRIIKVVGTLGFFIFIIIYSLFRMKTISTGVDLVVQNIENGGIYTEGVLEIKGNAKRAKVLEINGREISINQNGDFTDFLVLSPGYNIITVSAEDKFGKITKETFEVMREGKVLEK